MTSKNTTTSAIKERIEPLKMLAIPVGWVATDRAIAPYQVTGAGFVAFARNRSRRIWGNRQWSKPAVTAQTAIAIEWGQLARRDRAGRVGGSLWI